MLFRQTSFQGQFAGGNPPACGEAEIGGQAIPSGSLRNEVSNGLPESNEFSDTLREDQLDNPHAGRQSVFMCGSTLAVNSMRFLGYPAPMSTADLNYRSLPISERIELVEDIWDSIAEETATPLAITDEERAELDRRYAAHLADPSSSVPWEQVRAALFKGQR